ncbi:50S ribosomal protein L25 [Soehngenia longivitae]|uniref:Large ribosomal subunit protein bL25 n=1 Tax=Soehngenia longivitae TaxID=2562294 RepID=A0A4Z0D969_9FIRM|nr:50S ribosomal protein L25 [Soehngenia longivitae]TFZ41403.1 50S ribosomal protein L25 [Soehngenia longivitae]
MSYKLNAETREEIGKNKAKKIRKENEIPAIIYERNRESIPVKIDGIEFMKVFREAGTSNLIDLSLENETTPVIIKSVQKDPIKGNVIHVDLQRLDMKEKIKVEVPIILHNRDKIKNQPSVLMQMIESLEIECLPGDMPEAIEIDVEDLDFNEPIKVKNLDIINNPNVRVITDHDMTICVLNRPTDYKEELEEETEGSEPELVKDEEK